MDEIEIEIEIGTLSPVKHPEDQTTPIFRPLEKSIFDEPSRSRPEPSPSPRFRTEERSPTKGRTEEKLYTPRLKVGGGRPGDILSPSKLPLGRSEVELKKLTAADRIVEKLGIQYIKKEGTEKETAVRTQRPSSQDGSKVEGSNEYQGWKGSDVPGVEKSGERRESAQVWKDCRVQGDHKKEKDYDKNKGHYRRFGKGSREPDHSSHIYETSEPRERSYVSVKRENLDNRTHSRHSSERFGEQRIEPSDVRIRSMMDRLAPAVEKNKTLSDMRRSKSTELGCLVPEVKPVATVNTPEKGRTLEIRSTERSRSQGMDRSQLSDRSRSKGTGSTDCSERSRSLMTGGIKSSERSRSDVTRTIPSPERSRIQVTGGIKSSESTRSQVLETVESPDRNRKILMSPERSKTNRIFSHDQTRMRHFGGRSPDYVRSRSSAGRIGDQGGWEKWKHGEEIASSGSSFVDSIKVNNTYQLQYIQYSTVCPRFSTVKCQFPPIAMLKTSCFGKFYQRAGLFTEYIF